MSLRLFFSLIRIDLMFHASRVLISFVLADAIIGGMIVVVFDVYQSAPWTTVERRLFEFCSRSYEINFSSSIMNSYHNEALCSITVTQYHWRDTLIEMFTDNFCARCVDINGL